MDNGVVLGGRQMETWGERSKGSAWSRTSSRFEAWKNVCIQGGLRRVMGATEVRGGEPRDVHDLTGATTTRVSVMQHDA